MKILLVGSGGFIGSHLNTRLRGRYSVVSASTSVQSGDNHLWIDGADPDFLSMIRSVEPDVVINCMGAANVSNSFRYPEQDYRLNVLFYRQLLCALEDSGFAGRVLQMSSAAVYGNPNAIPIHETADLKPISPYGWHKLIAEITGREFAQRTPFSVSALRIFSAFGPGLRRQLLWDISQKSKEGSIVNLHGTGEEMRDFIYIKDIVNAVIAILECPDSRSWDAINIASGRRLTTRFVAEQLLNNLGWRGEVRFMADDRMGDPCVWEGDISLLKQAGFSPAFTFEAGVEELSQWLKELN